MPDDLLIQGGTVITMDPQRRVLETGHVYIRDGKIASVGPGEAPRTQGQRFIDARDKVVMPGFVNAHDHLDQPLYRGLFDDVAPGVRMRLLNRLTQAQTLERAYAAARLSLIELIKTGATFTAECYWVNTHPGSMHGLCRAVNESGMRGLLSRAMVTNNPFNPALSQSWTDVRSEIEGLKSAWDSDKITVTAEALSLGACEDGTVRAIHDFAVANRMLWSMHIQTEQVESIYTQYNCGPLEYMDRLGVLDQSLLAAHCNVTLPGEVQLMARSGVRVAHAPVAQMWAAKPIAYLMEWIAAGVRVGLGTDGALTNNGQNIFETLKFAVFAQRQKYANPLCIGSGELALELITIKAAEAVGLADRIGSLEPGKEGDVILLNIDHPGLNPRVALLSNLVYSCEPEAVDTVIVAGVPLMTGRRVHAFNEKEAVAEANRAQIEMIKETGLDRDDHFRRNHWLYL